MTRPLTLAEAAAVPQWCSIRSAWCTCYPRCEPDDDWERATFCSCDKGELTATERAERKCAGCGRQL